MSRGGRFRRKVVEASNVFSPSSAGECQCPPFAPKPSPQVSADLLPALTRGGGCFEEMMNAE
jgi:hypothetical protein